MRMHLFDDRTGDSVGQRSSHEEHQAVPSTVINHPYIRSSNPGGRFVSDHRRGELGGWEKGRDRFWPRPFDSPFQVAHTRRCPEKPRSYLLRMVPLPRLSGSGTRVRRGTVIRIHSPSALI
jgi:hypothetical protein